MRCRRSSTDCGGFPGLNTGSRSVMPSSAPATPGCCTGRNGADKVARSLSREASSPARLFGCAPTSSPTTASFPVIGSTQRVTYRTPSGPGSRCA